MSSLLDSPDVRERVLPTTLSQYHKLGEMGLIEERTELLRGVIIRKMIKSPQHTWMVQRLSAIVSRLLPDSFHVRQEQPLTFLDSEPEPDIAIVAGTIDDYQSCHPTTAQLVIEIAFSNTALDRAKADLYAENSVTEYWLILPKDSQIERFSSVRDGGYQKLAKIELQGQLSFPGPPSISVDLGWFPRDATLT